ncbi:MAG: hypothetical protein RJA44_1592, partial [Pseudomonadota bacterium]
DRLFVWACLDPDHPPSGLALHWRSIEEDAAAPAAAPAADAATAGATTNPTTSTTIDAGQTLVLVARWHTGVCWGDEPSLLIGPGDAPSLAVGSPSLLPEAGRWVRLEVSVDDLPLAGRTLDGMSFTLLGGRAAWGTAGRIDAAGQVHDWFGITLPAGATQQGDEPWDLMVDNDLWLPFEPDGGVSPSLPEQTLDTSATLGALATGGNPEDGVAQARQLPASLRAVLHPVTKGWRGHLLMYRTLRLLPVLTLPGLDLVLTQRATLARQLRAIDLFGDTAQLANTAFVAPTSPAPAPAPVPAAAPLNKLATVSTLGELVMPSGPDAPNALRIWVYLDEISPPRALCAMLTGVYVGATAPAKVVSNPSFTLRWMWGENRVDDLEKAMPGATGRAPLSAQALPQTGQWVQLELALPASGSLANEGVAATGLSVYTLTMLAFEGTVAFSDVSVDHVKGQTGIQPVWPRSVDDQGVAQPAPQALLNAKPVVLSGSQALRPTPSAHIGTVRSYTALIRDALLARLSRHEQSQLQLRGLGGFADYLRRRIDRADDITDFGFAHMQVDMHRIRQMMLSASDAHRLAVSPTLAAIAQSDNALAVSSQIRDFITSVRDAARASAPPAPPPPAGPLRSFVFNSAALGLAGLTAPAAAPAATAPAVKPSVLSKPRAAPQIVLSPPVLGLSEVRTTALAERLRTPPAVEARDYALSNRHRTVASLLELLRQFRQEDFGTLPALFDGFEVVGLPGDPFLAGVEKDGRRPLTDFESDAGLLARLLTPPSLLLPPSDGSSTPRTTPTDDIGALFTQAISLSDITVALLRQLEARLNTYRSALTRCESALAELQADADGATGRLARIADQLGEARHDVSVARALLAEETERIAAVNARRAQVLAEQVHFLAYIRPRETDNLLATPTHAVDPGLVEPPVPACLREHPDLPDELADMLRVVREAPAAWVVRLPVLLQRLDKVEQLQRALLVAQQRAVAGLALPMLMAAP